MLDIKIDSRKVVPGDVFVAIVGNDEDGHDYVEEAMRRGARKAIVSHPVEAKGPVEIVTDTKSYLDTYIKETYSETINQLTIIGITGTNGKTTTVSFIHQILSGLEVPSAYIGTLGYQDEQEHIPLHNTTPDIVTMYELLLHAKKKGIQVVAIEVSSHALKQKRMYGITLSYAGFLNITLDHLDYHKTMEDYVQTKALITTMVRKRGKVVINVDDAYSEYFKTIPYLSIGKMGQDYRILKYQYQFPYSYLTFREEKGYQVKLPIMGDFNMYNYVMAMSIIKELGYTIPEIIAASTTLVMPKGRSMIFPMSKGHVVIDYAHTPDAVENILKTVGSNHLGRVITVIGCGGERDQTKRPKIGKIATKYSDFVFFTNDNPRCEEPMKILDQMVAGKVNSNYVIIPDRKDAIKQAISILEAEDVVLVLGKGHEQYQIIGKDIIHHSDIEEVQKCQ